MVIAESCKQSTNILNRFTGNCQSPGQSKVNHVIAVTLNRTVVHVTAAQGRATVQIFADRIIIIIAMY